MAVNFFMKHVTLDSCKVDDLEDCYTDTHIHTHTSLLFYMVLSLDKLFSNRLLMQFRVHKFTVRWQPPLYSFNSENSKLYQQPLHPCSSEAGSAVDADCADYP